MTTKTWCCFEICFKKKTALCRMQKVLPPAQPAPPIPVPPISPLPVAQHHTSRRSILPPLSPPHRLGLRQVPAQRGVPGRGGRLRGRPHGPSPTRPAARGPQEDAITPPSPLAPEGPPPFPPPLCIPPVAHPSDPPPAPLQRLVLKFITGRTCLPVRKGEVRSRVRSPTPPCQSTPKSRRFSFLISLRASQLTSTENKHSTGLSNIVAEFAGAVFSLRGLQKEGGGAFLHNDPPFFLA